MPKPQKSIVIDSEENDDWIKLLPDYRDKIKVIGAAISKPRKSENKRVVRLKGGAGSGHHGHQGRLGKVGGSLPSSIEAYVAIFHGTPSMYTDSITKNGLRRGQEWFGRPPSVYYLTNEEEALDLAKEFIFDEEFAIVRADVPESFLNGSITDDKGNDDFGVETAARIEKDIPAEYLSSVDYYERVGYAWKPDAKVNHKIHVKLKENSVPIFVVVALKKPTVVRLKGGTGSGHQGHKGRPGKRGGSQPDGGKVYTQAELDRLAELARRKRERYHEKFSAAAKARAAQQQAGPTYKDGLYYDGDLEGKSSEEIYAGSHPDVQQLARETGLLATSKESHEYIKKLKDDGLLKEDSEGVLYEYLR
jgi:hypothetical protein